MNLSPMSHESNDGGIRAKHSSNAMLLHSEDKPQYPRPLLDWLN